ncbi:hypothetical protein GCM10023228_09820 [Brevibacillus fulvus]
MVKLTEANHTEPNMHAGVTAVNNFRNPFRNRRYKALVSPIGTTQLHLRKPLVIAAWSVAFPGFGHLLLNKYLRGYALIIWEMFINQTIHLNLAMVCSFNGQFQAARNLIDPKYMAMYIPVYFFAIWDSYRTTVDLNRIYLLAQRENAPYSTFSMGGLEINYLDRRKPWLAAIWSMGIPSVGQLYLHRIVFAAFVLIYTIIIVDQSNLLLAIHYLILGDISSSSAVLDPQWLLYFPSLYFFSIYDSTVNAIENNKLFEDDLRQYLQQYYQPAGKFVIPGSKVK